MFLPVFLNSIRAILPLSTSSGSSSMTIKLDSIFMTKDCVSYREYTHEGLLLGPTAIIKGLTPLVLKDEIDSLADFKISTHPAFSTDPAFTEIYAHLDKQNEQLIQLKSDIEMNNIPHKVFIKPFAVYTNKKPEKIYPFPILPISNCDCIPFDNRVTVEKVCSFIRFYYGFCDFIIQDIVLQYCEFFDNQDILVMALAFSIFQTSGFKYYKGTTGEKYCSRGVMQIRGLSSYVEAASYSLYSVDYVKYPYLMEYPTIDAVDVSLKIFQARINLIPGPFLYQDVIDVMNPTDKDVICESSLNRLAVYYELAMFLGVKCYM